MQLFVASCSGRTVFKFTARQQSELHPPATAHFSLLSCPSPTVLAIALAQWLRCKRQPHYIKHKTLKNRFELPFRLAFVRVDAYYAYAELLRKSKCSQSSQHDAQLLQEYHRLLLGCSNNWSCCSLGKLFKLNFVHLNLQRNK